MAKGRERHSRRFLGSVRPWRGGVGESAQRSLPGGPHAGLVGQASVGLQLDGSGCGDANTNSPLQRSAAGSRLPARSWRSRGVCFPGRVGCGEHVSRRLQTRRTRACPDRFGPASPRAASPSPRAAGEPRAPEPRTRRGPPTRPRDRPAFPPGLQVFLTFRTLTPTPGPGSADPPSGPGAAREGNRNR